MLLPKLYKSTLNRQLIIEIIDFLENKCFDFNIRYVKI